MDDARRIPRGLRRLLDQLTIADRYRKFRLGHGREPESDDEVDEYVLHLAREVYAAGLDEWPPDDEECE